MGVPCGETTITAWSIGLESARRMADYHFESSHADGAMYTSTMTACYRISRSTRFSLSAEETTPQACAVTQWRTVDSGSGFILAIDLSWA